MQTKIEEENKQLKNQLQSKTEQLNQSETVQRDFVRLSQSLQVHIKKNINKMLRRLQHANTNITGPNSLGVHKFQVKVVFMIE